MPSSTAITEPLFYHQPGPGYLALLFKQGGRVWQRSYPLVSMAGIFECLDPTIDTWISQGEFFRPNRRLVNLARIGLSFVDLDTYKTPELKRLDPQRLVYGVLTYCDDARLPSPSLMVYSGRGLQPKWFYEKPIPRPALPRWNAVQRVLVEKLAACGADHRAKDASRVLRLEGTRNSRTGMPVEVIWQKKTWGGEVARYPFDAFADEVLPACRQEIQERRKKKQAERQREHNTAGLRPFSQAQLSWDRLEDLRQLCRMRGWTREGTPEGFRDTVLFLATAFLAWVVPAERLHYELRSLVKEFCPTLAMNEAYSCMSSTLRRAKEAEAGRRVEVAGRTFDRRYRFRNQTIIELLQITAQEERQLRTIITEAMAKERHRKRQRRYGDRAAYRAAAQERRQRAIALRRQGKSLTQIAAELGCTRQHVERLMHLERKKLAL